MDRAIRRRGALGAALVVLLTLLMISPVSTPAAIYWASGRTIGGAQLDGSNSDLSYIGAFDSLELGSACGVAVDGAHIYWADRLGGRIGRANLDNTEPNFSFIAGAPGPCGVAVDSGHIYWANLGGDAIGRANLDGSGVSQKFVGGMRQPCGVAVDGSFVYWTSVRDNTIGRALLANPGVATNELVTGVTGACGVALDATHLYWGSFGTSIGRANRNGSEANLAFVDGLNRPAGVAVDSSHIYWTEEGFGAPGSLGTATLDGTGVNRALVTSLASPIGVAVDGLPFPLDRSAHLPLSSFRFAKVKRGKSRRDPVVFVAVDVPEAGPYRIVVPRGFAWNSTSAIPPESDENRFASSGRKWFAIYLDQSGVGRRLARKLERKGRLRFSLTLAYAAPDHNEATKTKKLLLVELRKQPLTQHKTSHHG